MFPTPSARRTPKPLPYLASPLTGQRELATRIGNESMETIDAACQDDIKPWEDRMKILEETLPRLFAATEDSLARLAQAESIAETLEEVKSSLEETTKTQRETQNTQAAMQETLKQLNDSFINSVGALRRDVNTVMEEASETRKSPFDQAPLRETAKAAHDHGGQCSDTKYALSAKATRSNRTSSKKNKKAIKPSPRSGTSRRHTEDDTTTSEESDNSQQYGAATTDEEADAFLPFFQRKNGPKRAGLSSIIPPNRLYDKLMSYRYYRLMRTDHRRNADANNNLSRLLKSLDLTFKEHKFSGSDPILVFDFLTRIVEEADMLGMTEGQLFVLLPHMLTGEASSQFRVTVKGSTAGGVTNWPEATQYFLRIYATTNAIRNATQAFRSIKQQLHEDENAF